MSGDQRGARARARFPLFFCDPEGVGDLVAGLCCWCQLSPLDVFSSCRSTEKSRSKMTESLVNKAKLAEQAERYDDMAEVERNVPHVDKFE